MTLQDTPNNTSPDRSEHDSHTLIGSQGAGDVLVIVAKYPQPGKVKTRLGATIGHDHAATLYAAFLRDLSERFTTGAQSGAYDLRWACVDDMPDGSDMRKLRALLDANATETADTADAPRATSGNAASTVNAPDAPGPQVFAQRGADLAERLYNICADMRAAGYRRLVIHGSDSPQASLGAVQNAFAQLAAHDVVVGPATDGGYYLIGLHLAGPASDAPDGNIGADAAEGEPAGFPDLFQGVGMSEATTLQQTLARADQLGLSVAPVETTFDVDEAADLTRLADHLRTNGAQAAPHTATALAGLAEADAAVGAD